MRWGEILLRVAPDALEPVSACLEEIGCGGLLIEDPGAVSSDPYGVWDDRPTPRRGEPATVRGYLPVDDRLEPALDDLQRRLALLVELGLLAALPAVTLRPVAEDEWAEAWKAHFHVQRVGQRLVIVPSWEPYQAALTDVVLHLDPGMAFGTGTHPTTRLCLEVLESVTPTGGTVLDWGTGSGILAMAAARLGADAVDAWDLDPIAVRVAGENIRRNELESRISVHQGSLEDTTPGQRGLLIANILPDPILAGMPLFRERLAPGGLCLLSGIVTAREEEIQAGAKVHGLRLVERHSADEWVALVYRPEP